MENYLYDYNFILLRKMSKKEFRKYMLQEERKKVSENKNNHSPSKDK